MADRTEGTPRRQRRVVVLLSAVLALLAGALAAVATQAPADEPLVVQPTTTTTTLPPTTTTTTTTPAPRPDVPLLTLLATPKGEIPTFDAPDGKAIGTVGIWFGYPMTMPIVQQHGAWVRIRLPERPNGSTAWVHRDDVTTSSTRQRIVINLRETKLTVYEDGFPLFTAPVGIGADSTPTAPGSFFVAVIEKPGRPGYGPLVLHTSGHSEAIQSWEGTGDAITSIHGPISARSDAQIGATGTKISNGCIRMHEEDQLKLDVIALGTPVDIVG